MAICRFECGRCALSQNLFKIPPAGRNKPPLERLFAFERFRELNMVKTTNVPEGHFGNLKRKLGRHHRVWN